MKKETIKVYNEDKARFKKLYFEYCEKHGEVVYEEWFFTNVLNVYELFHGAK